MATPNRNKTVRHQEISVPVEKDSSAPRHFGTVEKDSSAPKKFGIRTNQHRIFFQTNVITFYKIKSTKVKKTHQSAIKLKEKFSQGFI